MNNIIRRLIPRYFRDRIRIIIEKGQLLDWEKNGRPVPPPHRIKQLIIEEYQKKCGISIFVETGTYLGEMVMAQIKNFKTIYSIELGQDLWKQAVKKFRKYNNVNILHGDSGKVLKDLVPVINDRIIFWLDGHYSGGITAKGQKECPIYEELEVILNSKKNHIILIDDARCFNGKGDYPSIENLTDYVLARYRQSQINVINDVIRIELEQA